MSQARCEGANCESVLAGFPKSSTFAIGAHSMVRDLEDHAMLKKSVEHVIDFLVPANLLWYGSEQYGVADYPRSKGTPVHMYPTKGARKPLPTRWRRQSLVGGHASGLFPGAADAFANRLQRAS